MSILLKSMHTSFGFQIILHNNYLNVLQFYFFWTSIRTCVSAFAWIRACWTDNVPLSRIKVHKPTSLTLCSFLFQDSPVCRCPCSHLRHQAESSTQCTWWATPTLALTSNTTFTLMWPQPALRLRSTRNSSTTLVTLTLTPDDDVGVVLILPWHCFLFVTTV